MAILIDEKNRIFTIHTVNSTYQMKADKFGFLLHLYYGRKTEGNMDYLLTYADRGFSVNPYDAGDDRTYSLDVLPQEYPCRGNGDFRSPAIDIKNADGSYGCDLRFKEYKISKGKYGIQGLPAVYADDTHAETLEIVLADDISNIEVKLLYGVIPDIDIITRSVSIKNTGNNDFTLTKVLSVNLDFVCGSFDMTSFYGRHMMERNVQKNEVLHGEYKISSRRGTSSHQYNPFLILSDKNATEETGSCYAMSFVYSGEFLGEVSKDQFNQTRMQMGLNDERFSYLLKSGEIFNAPEVILTYSSLGMGELSRNLHKCIRKHICRGKYRDIKRPVLLNSWEAAYMDFTGDTILELAKEAAALGIEMIVMDDGWFGNRNDDNTSLGDWAVNEQKLGCPLKELVEKVNGMGLKFGVWIEPEMVNEESALYKKHPDWVLKIPGRKPVRGRNQLVLDFSRKEIVDEIFNRICKILDECNIEYIKWDANRSIADVYSVNADDQGKVLYDYVLGLYDFLERLNERYPDILIEGCSGGGGRFDAGMLYYTPQIWCSDNSDAIDRIKIQYGTSFGYPVSAMGAHVSASPNHQTGRNVSLETRGIVAMSGTFGYELDLKKLIDDEKEEIKEQINFYHKYKTLIDNGDYYRLSSPYSDECAAWEYVSEDKSEVLLSAVMLENHGNMIVPYVKLAGLQSGKLYKDEESEEIYPADALMETGIPVFRNMEIEEHQACQIHLVRI